LPLFWVLRLRHKVIDQIRREGAILKRGVCLRLFLLLSSLQLRLILGRSLWLAK
jgi:hypothetical protein